MDRYALISTKMPREFVLLQGTECRWRKCTFCDYHEDVSERPFEVNEPVLRQVTGQYGVLDVINSGSAMELDEETIAFIKEVVKEKKIHTLWFEAHYMYRKKLASFAEQFAPVKVKFRCGVETFDANLRDRWKKGIPSSVTPEDIAKYFQGVCLLLGTEGESKEYAHEDPHWHETSNGNFKSNEDIVITLDGTVFYCYVFCVPEGILCVKNTVCKGAVLYVLE